MRKVIVCVGVILSMMIFAGCGDKNTALKDAGFLTAAEYWYFYDEVTGENEKMSFSQDGSFYWGCECGEPVGDSDLYELYAYDKETQTITLYNDYDDFSMEIKVLDYSDFHLLLEIEGDVKGYTYQDIGIDSAASEKYIAGYNIYGCIISGDAAEVVIGPCDYDGDVEYPEKAINTYAFADDVQFFDLNIRRVVTETEETQDLSYTQISEEEALQMLDSGASFIWFNEEMKIEKMTFYGAVEIYE